MSSNMESAIIHLYNRGMSKKSIASSLGVNRPKVIKVTRGNEKSAVTDKLSRDARDAAIVRLFQRGMSKSAIVKAMGNSRVTVIKAIDNMVKEDAEEVDQRQVKRKTVKVSLESVVVGQRSKRVKTNSLGAEQGACDGHGVIAGGLSVPKVKEPHLDYSQSATHKRHPGLGPLVMHSYTAIRRPKLTASVQSQRLEASLRLLNDLKRHTKKRVIVFTERLLLSVDDVRYPHHERIIVFDDEDPNEVMRKVAANPPKPPPKPSKIMVMLLITSEGQKGPICFFDGDDEGPNCQSVVQRFEQTALPWLKKTFPENNYVLQLGNAPSNMAKETQKFLQDNDVKVWPKGFWPRYSDELSPLAFGVVPYVKNYVRKSPKKDMTALKKVINEAWKIVPEKFIKGFCSEFRGRVEAIIYEKGGYI